MRADTVALVPFEPSHFDTLIGWFASEAEMVQWAGPTLTWPLDRAQLQTIHDEMRAVPMQRLAWMAQVDGAFVGHCQMRFDWRNDTAGLARIAIAPDRRGEGLARRMLAPLVDKAFAFPEIMRLELRVYSFNAAAIRSYAGLGFMVEGELRQSARVGHERWNTVLMAILRDEWQARQAAGK